MVELIADFVNGFVEQIGFEHDLKVVAIFRNENRAIGRVQIALQKHAAHLAIPQIGPALQKRHVFLAHSWLPKRAVCGILKRRIMAATSRSAERFSLRSLSGLAGSPSKSSMTKSFPV